MVVDASVGCETVFTTVEFEFEFDCATPSVDDFAAEEAVRSTDSVTLAPSTTGAAGVVAVLSPVLVDESAPDKAAFRWRNAAKADDVLPAACVPVVVTDSDLGLSADLLPAPVLPDAPSVDFRGLEVGLPVEEPSAGGFGVAFGMGGVTSASAGGLGLGFGIVGFEVSE